MHASNVWVDDTANPTHTRSFAATDQGLGLYKLKLTGTSSVTKPDGFGIEDRNGVTGEETITAVCPAAPPSTAICPTAWPTAAIGYKLPEGVNALSATMEDMAGNQAAPPRAWTEKIDRTPPAIDTISGSLYNHRDSTTPSESETLTDPQYDIHVSASDQRSGVRSIDVRIGTTLVAHVDGSCAQQGCGLALDKSVNIDALNLNDGPYTLTVTAYDYIQDAAVADRHKTSTSFPIYIDRTGDVVHAEEWDADPTISTSSSDAGQWAVPGAGNARTEEDVSTSTLGSAPCPAGICAQATTVSDDDGSGPGAPDYRRTLGTSASDPRVLDGFLTSQAPSGTSSTSTGSLSAILATWQVPPPKHGSTYTRYRRSTSEIIDGVETTIVDDVYTDAATNLPVRLDHQEGVDSPTITYYVYDKDAAPRSGFPADFFALTVPNTAGSNTSTTLPAEDANGPAPPPETDASLIDRSLDQRTLLGLTTDTSVIQGIVADVASPVRDQAMDLVGIPLSANELATVNTMLDTQSYGSELDQFASDHKDSYAGAYINEDNKLVVRMTSTTSVLEQALRALVPIGDRMIVQSATMTLSQLTNLQHTVEADKANGVLSAYDVRGIAINEQDSTLMLSLANNSAQVQSELQARYGGSVRTRDGGYPELFAAADPGQLVDAEDATGIPAQFSCTLGINAYRRNPNTRRRSNFATTAGHCSEELVHRPILWRFRDHVDSMNGIPWSAPVSVDTVG
jgi:hypothetical protein